MNQNVAFEEISLEKYIQRKNPLDESRRSEIEGLVERLEHDALNVERLPLKLLKTELLRYKYPVISPEFLSMSKSIEFRGNKIQVPRFCTYPKTNEGFGNFIISMFDRGGISYIPEVRLNIAEPLLVHHLVNSFEFSKHSPYKLEYVNDDYSSFTRNILIRFGKIPREVGKRYKPLFNARSSIEVISLLTQFAGIIPEESKERLREAERIFGDNLYLVSEVQPEQWHESRVTKPKITKDPLIIGVSEERDICFLVDHFNTTSIEDYVRKEFTQ